MSARSSFVGSPPHPYTISPLLHLTPSPPQQTGAWEVGVLAAPWHLVSSTALLEWRVMVSRPSDDHISPTFLATNLLSINCGEKGVLSCFSFYFVVMKLFFLLPSPPLLLQMTWRPPAQQTKQWCRLNMINGTLEISSQLSPLFQST